jgi:lipopolysaccharide export system permease protein
LSGQIRQFRPNAELKTLHKYLAGQVLASLLLTVTVFTFVLLLGNVLQEILKLLVNGQIGYNVIFHAVALLIPFVLVYSLPMGLLTATLLVFGRFSADQELTAARASGISLISLSTPILLLSLCCCALSAWINMDLGPSSREEYKAVINEARSDLANVQLPEGRLIYDFPGYIFLIGKNQNGNLRNVDIWQYNGSTNEETTYMFAPQGNIEMDATNKQLSIRLHNATSRSLKGAQAMFGTWPEFLVGPFNFAVTNKPSAPSINNMTFFQLQDELKKRERLLEFLPATTNTAAEWRAQIKETERAIQQVHSQMHEQIASSFACFGFALVGIPLGIRVHRRETNIGIAVALGLVLVYYSFIILGSSLASRPECYPHLIFWLPNFIFQAVGAVLLWRANKGI